MAGKQIAGDGVPPSLAGMSKNQLYEIMSQMKTLIEQNKQQARQILIQNPVLTRALFQAQIMLGMVQSPQAQSNIQPGKPSAISNKQSNIQPGSSFPGQTGQNQIRKHQQPNQTPNQKPNQNMVPNPHPQSIPINPQPQPTPSRPLQPQQLQQPKAHLGGQSTQMSIPHSSQVHNLTQLPQHSVSQPPSLHQPSMPSLSTQSQQPMQNSGNQYIPLQQPLQPPLPPQQRPPMPGFPHQGHAQMGQNNMGFQHPSGPQMHHSQHMFHSGAKPHGGMGPSFQQGQLPHPNQPLPPPLYQVQGGNPHIGMDFNQSGSSSRQPDRGGSNWTPGLQENTIGQFPGQPSFPGQVGPSNQPPPRPSSLAPDLEKQLLQQVMSLTQEQINQLPPEQRNQVLQLQQMLRQ
ncbi:cleavage stimulating factor 64 [Phtheirospermum japonicum]|uniref:Cleavage stimulating factor 64 n=1 Tax=Phtheirospermum japonicum TaxID=374723 RepID=A0A830CQS7_9LAMI|nr:cleavage stimulating factor 64 [Phtheirospermum japonicum]